MKTVLTIGVLLIASGTFIMIYIPILGIILIAIGTFVTLYFPIKDNKKDSDEVKRKNDEMKVMLEKFGEKLENAKNESSEPKKYRIIEIEDEYSKWAESFLSDKEAKLINLQKSNINIKETEIRLNKQWRGLYVYMLDFIKKSIDAFNSKTKLSIIYNISKVPDNIFLMNLITILQK
jgi:hypothetical protein